MFSGRYEPPFRKVLLLPIFDTVGRVESTSELCREGRFDACAGGSREEGASTPAKQCKRIRCCFLN